MSLNKISNVTVVPYVASSSYRAITLELRNGGVARTIHVDAEGSTPLRGNTLLVTAAPLDEVVGLLALRDVALVKIDVKGHEVQVLSAR